MTWQSFLSLGKNGVPKLIGPLFLAVALLLPIGSGADELEDFHYDIQLISALQEAGLVNYGLLQIELMLERYPDKEDHVRYAEARFHFNRGRRGEARRALNKIPEDSPFYTESLLLTAEQAINRGDLEEAARAYENYFAEVDQPASAAPADVEIFQEAVLYYAQTKIEAGEAREAAEILELLGNLPEDQAPESDGLLLTVAEAIFSAMENREEEGRSIDQDLVEGQIDELLEMQWRHGGASRLTVQAFIQAARARVLLGQPEEALNILQEIGEAAGRLEREFPDEPPLVPAAFYFYARAFEEMGRQYLEENNMREAERAFLRAAAFYNQRLIENYPDHSYADRAVRRYAQLENVVEENLDGRLPSLPSAAAGELAQKGQRADRYYQAGNYEQAIPLYQEIVDRAPEYQNLPQFGQNLVNAYILTGELENALEVTQLLADNFPEAEGTAGAMLLAGRAYLRKGQETEEEKEKQRLIGQAVEIWNEFVEKQPEHRNANNVAFFIAEHHYSQAVSLVRKSREASDPQVQEGLQEVAREAFRQCIPYYERMFDHFADTPEGVRSIYKLGWVYYNLDKGPIAAELFSRYSRLETARARSDDRLRAKLHAGEQLMLSDDPARGIKELEELLAWYEDSPVGLNTDTNTAFEIQENAANYLAWTYDRKAETVRPQLREIDQQIQAYEQAIDEAENRLAAVSIYEAGIEEEKIVAEEEWEEVKESILAELPDPEQMALDEVMPGEEELAGASEEDRERMKAAARQRAGRLADQYRERQIANYEGLISDLQEQRRTTRQELDEAEQELEKARENLQQAVQTEEDEFYIERLRQEMELREKEKQLTEQSLDADGEAIALLEAELEALWADDPEEREVILERRDYDNKRTATEEAYTELREGRIALAELELEIAEEQAAVAEKEIGELQEDIAALEEERRPIFARMKEMKQDALEQFAEFIEAYPDSDFVPEHLARIGTIHLELENFEQAVEYLDRLAGEFPEHEATMDAIFDLGRAQFETGNEEDAVETYEQVADRFSEQRPANLE